MTHETILLCQRIAHERTRPAELQAAAELRRDAARVLASGQSEDAVQAWLRGLLADALEVRHGRD